MVLPSSRPLAGLKILDLSRVLAGPYATMLLADMGADVIKIESPRGDETRQWGPPWLGEGDEKISAYYSSVNRNKRSVVLDLKTAAAKKVLEQLISQSDVLIENFRKGTLERLGFSQAKLTELNPTLIYSSITGYGSTGASADLAGYDAIIQALGGLMSLTGSAEGEASKISVALVDVVTGCHAAMAILAALVQRGVTGKGTRIELSLLESNMSMLVNQAANFLASQQNPQRWGNAHPNIVPYQQFHARDQAVMVAVGNDKQFQALCTMLELPQLASNPRFASNPARVQHRDILVPLLAETIQQHSAQELSEKADALGVPFAPVNTLEQAFSHPQVVARGILQHISHPQLGSIPQVSAPFLFDEAQLTPYSAPPLLGEHTEEVLREFAIEESLLQQL